MKKYKRIIKNLRSFLYTRGDDFHDLYHGSYKYFLWASLAGKNGLISFDDNYKLQKCIKGAIRGKKEN